MTHSTVEDIGALIDQRRKLSAEIAGINLRIATAIGDRDGARRFLKEMNAQTEARRAARFACEKAGAH